MQWKMAIYLKLFNWLVWHLGIYMTYEYILVI